MKALLPFILPLVVLIMLGIGFWRWLQNNSSEPTIDESAVSVQVTDVDQATTTELATSPIEDVPSVDMEVPEEAPKEAQDSTAKIRYQIKDKTVSLLVLAPMAHAISNLKSAAPSPSPTPAADAMSQPTSSPTNEAANGAPETETSQSNQEGQTFYVWIKPAGKDVLTKAFTLVEGKGGLMGSASIPVSALPMDVYVTTSQIMADVPTHTWLKGTIPAPVSE